MAADAYQAALARARGNVKNCDDAAHMASLLEGTAHILIGAVSPRLVWQGAQARGMTTMELAELIHSDPIKAADLMFAED